MKFILTSELGKLCKWLRILGYDTYYYKGVRSSLIIKSLQEGRIIVTRRKSLAEEKSVKKIILERNDLKEQIKELENKLNIKFDTNNIFSRCSECNVAVIKVDKKSLVGKVPQYVYQNQDVFYKCPQCKKIFWPGTHWELARKYLENILK